jgi:hypothetical protein
MKTFRKSKIIKTLCIFLAIAVFNLSCSVDNNNASTTSECSSIAPFFKGNRIDIANKFENMLELSRTLKDNNKPLTHDDYLKDVFKKNSDYENYIISFKIEADKYANLGHNNYLQDVNNRGLISNDLKNAFITFGGDVTNFINSQTVGIIEFSSFINTQKLLYNSTSLCSKDKKIMLDYLDLTQGLAQFYFKHFKDDNNSGLRGCNFLEAIGCGFLAILGFILVSAIIILTLNVFGISTDDPDDYPDDTVDGEYSEEAEMAMLAIGYYVGIDIFAWCCGLNKIKEQECLPPAGAFYTSHGCNDFSYTIFGPSNYGRTVWSGNTNTTPPSDVTSTPSRRFRVPNSGVASNMIASIACLSGGTNMTLFSWSRAENFVYNSTSFIEWNQSPPNTANVNTNYNISVNTSGNGIVVWNVTPFGGIVMSSGPNSGNVKFWTSGQKTVSATITDPCTNQSVSVSKTVFVQ